MRIEATDIGRTFGRQTRAYAEYRVFSSLAGFSDVVREAAVSLTGSNDRVCLFACGQFSRPLPSAGARSRSASTHSSRLTLRYTES